MTFKNKKNMFFSIIALLLFLSGCSIHTVHMEKQKKESKMDKKKYEQLLKTTAETMITASSTAEDMLNKYHDVWYDSIFNGYAEVDGEKIYGDFNKAVSAQQQLFEQDGTMELLEKSQDTITKAMKKLKNPPNEYKEGYNVLVHMYKVFNEYIDLAKSPEGSLQSFTEHANKLSDDLTSLYREFEIKIP
jgi:hypothetical protein